MPYVSDAQRRKFHAMANRGEISQKTVEHWDKASKGKKLPEKVHHKKAFVQAFVNTFFSKVAMTPEIAQALTKAAAIPMSSTAIADAKEQAEGAKALGDIAKAEQEAWKNKFFGHVATPAGLGMLGGAGLAKIFSPTNVEVDNLQKKELLAHYDAAIEELERRIASRRG